ncbi:MAG TPA: SDR family oxidoreductase [Caldilineaceae bacterium]|nr:SDR family oxidoreductase [Caldilineaceae bacterium]HRW09198.1 SDR family oxidoreductase [Caldilineaceae bacterium]
MLSRSPFQRYGSPEEVAQLMLFLASDESSYCSGGVYMVDGAWTT